MKERKSEGSPSASPSWENCSKGGPSCAFSLGAEPWPKPPRPARPPQTSTSCATPRAGPQPRPPQPGHPSPRRPAPTCHFPPHGTGRTPLTSDGSRGNSESVPPEVSQRRPLTCAPPSRSARRQDVGERAPTPGRRPPLGRDEAARLARPLWARSFKEIPLLLGPGRYSQQNSGLRFVS